MRTAEDLERLDSFWPRAPRGRGTVDLLVLRTGPGQHEIPESAELSSELGLVGDRWATSPHREVDRELTLMMRAAAEVVRGGQPLHLPGDNVIVNLDLGADHVPVGTRIRLGNAIVEVTAKPHAGCKKFAQRFGKGALEWVNEKRNLEQKKLRGINCRVVEAGTVKVGDAIEVLTRNG